MFKKSVENQRNIFPIQCLPFPVLKLILDRLNFDDKKNLKLVCIQLEKNILFAGIETSFHFKDFIFSLSMLGSFIIRSLIQEKYLSFFTRALSVV